MRRYWLSIIIVVLAVSGIGTYYSFSRQNYLPEYKLETIQGDPNEGAAITLSGSYYGDMRSYPLNVNISGSDYSGLNTNFRLSLTESLSWYYRQPDIQQLRIDHKSFMRGKANMSGVYRDEEWVIYSDVSLKNKGSEAPLAVFQLNFLHEGTDKVSKFEQIYELPYETSYLYVEDVQRLDEEVYILVSKGYTGSKPSEYEVFVMDLSSGKLLRNERFENWSSTAEDIQIQVNSITTDRYSAPTETIFFIVSEVKVDMNAGEDANYSDKLSEKYYSYSYRTGLLTELPDSLMHLAVDTYGVPSLQNDYFYFAVFGTDNIILSRYSLTTKKLERAYASVSAEQLGVDEIKAVLIRSNRMYLLLDQAGVPGAAVLDITNGDQLFTGRAAEIGDGEQMEDDMKENLHLLNIEIDENIKD